MESQAGRSEFVSESNDVTNLHTRINENFTSPVDSTFIQLGRNKAGYLYGNTGGGGFHDAQSVTFRLRASNTLDSIDVTMKIQVWIISAYYTVAEATFTIPGATGFTSYSATVTPESGYGGSSWPENVVMRIETAGADGSTSDRLKISAADYKVCDS